MKRYKMDKKNYKNKNEILQDLFEMQNKLFVELKSDGGFFDKSMLEEIEKLKKLYLDFDKK
jgi:hypothetical protein